MLDADEQGAGSRDDADGNCSVAVNQGSCPGIEQPAASGRHTNPSHAAQARHDRFQSKLVLGPASGMQRGGSAKDIVPQKRTPLEEQVYELKRKHPGVLLVIEVGQDPALIVISTHFVFC